MNTALQAISNVREAIVVSMQDECTPKDVRSGGSKRGIISLGISELTVAFESIGGCEAVQHAIDAMDKAETDLQALPWNSKAKAKTVLETLIEALDEAESMTEKDNTQAVARLPEIEETIRNQMQVASGALLVVGELLNEAREEFDNAKEFLAWADAEFGFKKAYCYRLMKVADEFSQEDVLAGQSINVLNKLAGMPEEVKTEAREKVEAGEELTGKAVEQMGKALAGPDTEEAEEAESKSTAVDNTSDFGDDDGAPWSSVSRDQEVPEGSEPTPVPTQDSEVQRLRDLVSELKAELAAARQEREGKATEKAQAPMLPQFVSECHYARLGLSVEQGQDAKEVRKAFRALVKVGYSSQHEAYQALLDAKESLMQVAEAA